MSPSGKHRATLCLIGVIVILAGLVLVPAVLSADGGIKTRKVRCGISHFLRNVNLEIRTATIVFDNGDPVNPATVDRLTIFDFFGDVVHDSGPAVGVLHPLNTDFAPPGIDITVVPPSASFYIATNHIWDANSIPTASPTGASGNERGNALAAVVQFSKQGKPDLFQVHGRSRSRVRNTISGDGFSQGTELSSNQLFCFPLKDFRDED